MALRNIIKIGDPGLLKKSRDVTDFNKRLHILLDDMRETLEDSGGLGLAAPQVGVLRRVVLIVETTNQQDDDIEYEINAENQDTMGNEDESLTEDDNYRENVIELINPELIYEDGEQTGSEGCLSLPGQYGMVSRPLNVRVKAQDRYGDYLDFEASGMTARAVCHEIDHLNGIIFTSIAKRMLTDEEIEEMRNNRTREYNEEDTGE